MLSVVEVMLNEPYEPLISFWSKSTMSAIPCTGSPVTLGCVLHHFPEQLSVTELVASVLALKSNGAASTKNASRCKPTAHPLRCSWEVPHREGQDSRLAHS